MPDVQRTLADLLTVQFPDGLGTGAIVAQTIRDLVVSLMPVYGAMAVTAAAPTTIATPGTYVKAAGGTGIPSGITLASFSSPAHNRLTYDGTVPVHCFVSGSVAISAGGANKKIGIKVAKNGVVIDESIVTRTLGSSGDVAALSIHAGVDLNPTDFVELFVTTITDTTSPTVEEMYFHIIGGIK